MFVYFVPSKDVVGTPPIGSMSLTLIVGLSGIPTLQNLGGCACLAVGVFEIVFFTFCADLGISQFLKIKIGFVGMSYFVKFRIDSVGISQLLKFKIGIDGISLLLKFNIGIAEISQLLKSKIGFESNRKF